MNRYDYLAYKHRAIILPSCGLNSLLSDIIVHISAKTLEGVNHPIEQAKSQWLPTVGIASSKTSFQLNLAGPGHGPCHALSSVMEACYEQPRVSDSLSPGKDQLSLGNALIYKNFSEAHCWKQYTTCVLPGILATILQIVAHELCKIQAYPLGFVLCCVFLQQEHRHVFLGTFGKGEGGMVPRYHFLFLHGIR